jgi:hypothetical protein
MTAVEGHRTDADADGTNPLWLVAGPLTVLLADGDLRCIRFGKREVVRRIYGAVRDRNWVTVSGTISDLHLSQSKSAFRLRYTREHVRDEIHFVWQADITGEADGTIRFTFDGEAKSTFLRNRIGLCVLHPIRECAGARCRTLHADGSTNERVFPELVAIEQPIAGFTDLAGLAHEVVPGLWLETAFEGDLFETEDQRNWIDASYKTYSTPLRLPFPAEIPAGTRIRQSVALRLRNVGHGVQTAVPVRDPAQPIRVRLSGAEPCRLPEIGLGMASHGGLLGDAEAQRLSRLGLSHLRADLRLGDANWSERLRAAARDGMELGTALELALHLPRTGPGELAAVARELRRLKVDLTRALVFRDGQRSTLPADLESVRVALADCGLAVGVGTDSDLYHLHLQPPPADGDFLCWSMNPQVHATDDSSIAETPEAVVQQLATVRHRHPGLSLVVSPITLKPRFNPVATTEEDDTAIRRLPAQVDVRQVSLFAAAWTLAMFKAIAEGGAQSITFFETTGWRGVMETASGSPMPELFPTFPGCVFPLYHVFADIGEFTRGMVVPTATDDFPNVTSLLLRNGTNNRLVIANLSAETRRVALPVSAGNGRLRILDDTTVQAAMKRPEHFRSERTAVAADELLLTRHAIATLDFTEV